MQFKLILAMSLAAAATVAFGQHSAVSITFPEAGDRDVWIGRGLPDRPPGAESKEFHDASATLPTASAQPTDAVFVWDHKSGNLASKTVKDATSGGAWMLKPEDFHDVAEAKVHVERDGKPVAAAIVLLQDGRRTQQQLVDSSSQGDAVFFALKPGSLKVTVQYKSNGNQAKPVVQILDAPLIRTDPIPTLTVSVPEPTDSADSGAAAAPANQPASGQPGTAKPAGGSSQGSPVGTFIGYLLGIALAVGVGILVVRYFTSHGDTVAAKLEQLGVQIPKPGDQGLTDPASLAAPIPTPKPVPQQKIILDDAAPNILGAATPIPNPIGSSINLGGSSASYSPSAGPQLRSSGGDAIPLADGEFVVGRDPGLGLSLIGETTVSRKHAQLVRSGDVVIVRDLGSTNGTFVNGMKVSQDTTLRQGDQVQFGAVQFRYEG